MKPEKGGEMKTGFSKREINPPIGTSMSGWPGRDRMHGCEGIHDSLYVRSLYCKHDNKEILIITYDLLFFNRAETDRLKGAIGRKTGFTPWQILISTSHTHNGPKVGTFLYDIPADESYFCKIESETLVSIEEAMRNAVESTVWAGVTTTRIPLNRRKPDGNGKIQFAPNTDGSVCNSLPVCMFKDLNGKPISLIFSVSCHPSIYCNFEISADYPGVAMNILDEYMGINSSMFLQGCGGDSKPNIDGAKSFSAKSWDCVTCVGKTVADEVTSFIGKGRLAQVAPKIVYASAEMHWPLMPHIGKEGFQKVLELNESLTLKHWAEYMLSLLNRGYDIPGEIPITLHGIKLGDGLRFLGLEGEAVADLGKLIMDFYKSPVTFPLGYANGTQLYLPTSAMISEGGYEVESFSEYKVPSQLKDGMEKILMENLKMLEQKGIN